jgi:hypothetical protein
MLFDMKRPSPESLLTHGMESLRKSIGKVVSLKFKLHLINYPNRTKDRIIFTIGRWSKLFLVR